MARAPVGKPNVLGRAFADVRGSVVAVACLCLAFASSGCLGSGGGIFGGGGPGPKDFVSDDQYTKWVIEVDTVQGQDPPAGVLDFLKGRLVGAVSKPDGVEIRIDETLPARGGTWSQKDVLDYSDAHFQTATSGKTAALHLMFVDGAYEQSNVLGVTFSRATGSGRVVETGPVVIFSNSIRSNCGPICASGTTPAFRSVLVHEFGHAMGLVNSGIDMVKPHEASTCNNAPDHGHSSNTQSVMNCSVETNGIFSLLNTPPTEYDGDDHADLCNAGGKC
ncbi:MAG: hypothetical protein QOJ26_847 [Thermoplasmata archaeon]|nr:hypothetical protein [Thermoplasmata archaeon]MEA3165978.1 hypothetical protein [Thermoplasmata archaeon]